MTPAAVLHVTSLLGGGVDRHVRDIARALPGRHVLWHTGEGADVLELAGDQRYFVLDPRRFEADPEALAGWLRAMGVAIAHLHTTLPAGERRARWASKALGVESIVTLHDVLFLRPDAFSAPRLEPDCDWLARTSALLRDCRAVLAPSEFVAGLARHHIPGLEVQVVPNGSPPMPAPRPLQAPEAFERQRPRSVVGVLGAVGPHKGSELLDALAALLEGTDLGIVVIGFLEKQLVPGWRVPGRLFVHGAWADDDVSSLAHAYGVDLVLFPNRVPESFSYALSDAWACALPVLAAPLGALAERISRHGGGWLLPEGFDAAIVAARLEELLSPDGKGELARVRSQLSSPDPGRIPPLEAMARSLEVLYERYGIDPHAEVDTTQPDIQRLLAVNLDGALLRLELERMAGEVADANRERDAMERDSARLRLFEHEARDWIAKLEADIATLKAGLEEEVRSRRELGQRLFEVEGEARELRIHKRAFDLLPGVVRKLLLKKILDARS
jgi:glycosyltransferase involved in cell wall biosynthesis